MGGLLYKDFISIRGKKVSLILSCLLFLFLSFRLWKASPLGPGAVMVENAYGEMVDFVDVLIFSFPAFFSIGSMTLLSLWVPNVIRNDEKGKIRSYLTAMPVGKRTYVAEKYVFIGICVYASFSVYLISHVIAVCYMEEGASLDLAMLWQSFAIELFSFALLVASIEFPVFFAFGAEKGQMIKTGIMECLGVLAICYLFFGDLDVFEKLDLERLIRWAEEHDFVLILMSVLSPLITLGIYYGSYRISVRIYERKEGADE